MIPTSAELAVRPYTRGDKAPLLELIKAVWSYKNHIEMRFNDRWWWQWETPPLYLIEDPHTSTLVGVCGYLPFTLRAGGRELSCAWFLDFFVLAAYQGRGLGKRLTRAVQERFAITASLSQSETAYHVFRTCGWSTRCWIPVYTNLFPLRVMFPSGAGSRTVAAFAMEAPPPIGMDLDGLWTRVRDSYAAIAVRDAASLFRRYASTEQRDYTLLCCWRGTELTGYAVIRLARPTTSARASIGFVVDYLADPADRETFSTLLSAAARRLLDGGASRIYCASTVPGFARVLRSCGFVSPETPLVGRMLRSRFNMGLTAYRTDADSPDPSTWFLSMGDCDIDAAWYLD